MAQNTERASVLARDGYPVGVPCWIDTSQRDPDAAASFYGELFGWEFEMWPSGQYRVASVSGLDVAGIAHLGDGAEPSWNTYIQVDSADWATADAIQLGGRALMPPFDVAEAGRMSVIEDPTGAVFCMWEPKGHNGARLVNAAGSWNWSDLHTPDPSLAEPFYRALFGWDATAVAFGEMTATMWRRPGYGDALEKRDPGIRERHEQAGAPEGFADAVGWLIESEGPSRWNVTFSVDDTDASAERAAELGGEVLVPPYDAGPVRIAQLKDPQGAEFTISRYDPS
jgi:predicted enzyme related to lactoylglutathione lyase